MNHKTTIEYYIPMNYLNVEDVIFYVNKLKQYILEKKDEWGFEFQMDNKIYTGADISLIFDELIQFLGKNTLMEKGADGSFINFLEYGKYVVDVTSGVNAEHNVDQNEYKFNNSIIIVPDKLPIEEHDSLGLLIFANLPRLFANELYPNDEGIGIECVALDINGYEFEFII